MLVALVIAAFFSSLAWLAWHHRDAAAEILTCVLLGYGGYSAWRALPISAAIRARWNEEEKMLREYPPSFWRFLLWIGVFRIIDDVLVHPDKHFDPVYPTLLIVGGIISYVLCRRYLRKVRGRRVGRQKQSPEAASPQRG